MLHFIREWKQGLYIDSRDFLSASKVIFRRRKQAELSFEQDHYLCLPVKSVVNVNNNFVRGSCHIKGDSQICGFILGCYQIDAIRF